MNFEKRTVTLIAVDIRILQRQYGVPDTRPFPIVGKVRPSGVLGRAPIHDPVLSQVPFKILNVAITQSPF
jgi:hypothetical protein